MDAHTMRCQCSHQRHEAEAGYTLVEIIVAVSVFALLLGSAGGVYLSFTRGQRSNLGQATVLGEIETFFESLERDLRTGFGTTFASTGNSFSFTNQDRQNVSYQLSGTRIRRLANGVGGFVSSPRMAVRELTFAALSSTVDPGPPPILTGAQGRVTVRLRACPSGVNDGRCIIAQTTLTSRQYVPP